MSRGIRGCETVVTAATPNKKFGTIGAALDGSRLMKSLDAAYPKLFGGVGGADDKLTGATDELLRQLKLLGRVGHITGSQTGADCLNVDKLRARHFSRFSRSGPRNCRHRTYAAPPPKPAPGLFFITYFLYPHHRPVP